MDREKLYYLINSRAAAMYEEGLEEETRKVMEHVPGARTFLSSIIGYSQAARVLEGEMDRAAAIEETARHTRRYAKRQLTWLRSMPGVRWLNKEESGPEEMARRTAAEIKY